MAQQHLFISAIGTDSGKTVASAIVCQALNYNYWKPIQCGFPTDTETVRNLVSSSQVRFYEETYLLKTPASPHIAAEIENHEIFLPVIETEYNTITESTVIEGAGGILVPINDSEVIIDIPGRLDIPVILVVNFYLGSINHTLLTISELKRRGIKIIGMIFNGEDPQNTKNIILTKSGLRELLHIRKEELIDQKTIQQYAKQILPKLS